MEAIMQAKIIGQDPQVAILLNSNGTKTTPTTESVTQAMQKVAADTEFSRHNFLTILDVNDPKAYPIALMSFVLLRENYFWFTPGSETDCERVKALVYFWYYFLTDPDVVETNLNNGWVSISGDLLQDNMRALSLITCNRKNVMDELTVELKRQAFYIGRDSDYDWDYSLDFWSNNLKFETSKYGSTLYVLFYIILILVNATPFTTNMIQYFRKTSSQIEQDEVEVEKTFSQTGSFLNVLAENDIEEDLLRKHFDFKDEEWYIYVDSVAKTFIIILYFNVPNEYFLPITMSLLIGIALCSLLGKPNEIFWYNYFRGGMYVYCAIVCLVLFVLELKVSKTDYDLREYLCYTISISVLGSTIILSVASYLHLTRKYKAGMTDGEIKLKEEELQKFFAAFGNDEKAGSKSEIRRNRSLTQSSTTASTLDNVEGVKILSVPPETKNTSFSKLQWNQLDTMIVSARSINLLTQDEVKAIRLAIKYEDPMIVLVFERSDRELHKFVEGLKVKVFQALAKGPNDRGTRLYSCQMPLISPVTEKKQVNTVV
ncbi:hypothetical protein HDU79_002546 [Rhizoclosmatium sp. JEL0117]|nr:hypothetical protein HDU79_002546 [Rhizoclosmatium sp. JEL0117]